MEFCEKCGKLLKIEGNKGKCSCGFEKELKEGEGQISETHFKRTKKGEGYVKWGNELATFPHKCKKCGYDKAQVIDLGVWIGDEAGVIRFKCGKCGFAEQVQGSNS